MGSKIPKGRSLNGDTFTALEYESGNDSWLIYCCSTGCTARLSFVKRHLRHYLNNNTINIAPCFRLKAGESHAEDCKYNIDGQLQIIAKDSDSEVFSAIKQSSYTFRLHVLIKALWAASDDEVTALGKKWGSSNDANKAYKNKGKLTNYLRTLGQILELRSYCIDNDAISKKVKLDYNGESIKWCDFYYDSFNLKSLVPRHGAGLIKIPLAIAGDIYNIDVNPKKCRYVLELQSPPSIMGDDGKLVTAAPQVAITNQEVYAKIDSNKEYLFFGLWEVVVKEKPRKTYQNIRMSICEADHFIEI